MRSIGAVASDVVRSPVIASIHHYCAVGAACAWKLMRRLARATAGSALAADAVE
jgi:hypothetical protein